MPRPPFGREHPGRRLEHLRYLAGDPLVARFCGLARIPLARTVSNWLKQFTQATLRPLIALNHMLVMDMLERLQLPRLTIDVDGSVVRTARVRREALRSVQAPGFELPDLEGRMHSLAGAHLEVVKPVDPSPRAG